MSNPDLRGEQLGSQGHRRLTAVQFAKKRLFVSAIALKSYDGEP